MGFLSRLFRKEPTRSKAPTCAQCGKQLELLPSFVDHVRRQGGVVLGSTPKEESFRGTVCINCGTVYCKQCQGTGGRPCPKCGQIMKQAAAYNLKEARR